VIVGTRDALALVVSLVLFQGCKIDRSDKTTAHLQTGAEFYQEALKHEGIPSDSTSARGDALVKRFNAQVARLATRDKKRDATVFQDDGYAQRRLEDMLASVIRDAPAEWRPMLNRASVGLWPSPVIDARVELAPNGDPVILVNMGLYFELRELAKTFADSASLFGGMGTLSIEGRLEAADLVYSQFYAQLERLRKDGIPPQIQQVDDTPEAQMLAQAQAMFSLRYVIAHECAHILTAAGVGTRNRTTTLEKRAHWSNEEEIDAFALRLLKSSEDASKADIDLSQAQFVSWALQLVEREPEPKDVANEPDVWVSKKYRYARPLFESKAHTGDAGSDSTGIRITWNALARLKFVAKGLYVPYLALDPEERLARQAAYAFHHVDQPSIRRLVAARAAWASKWLRELNATAADVQRAESELRSELAKVKERRPGPLSFLDPDYAAKALDIVDKLEQPVTLVLQTGEVSVAPRPWADRFVGASALHELAQQVAKEMTNMGTIVALDNKDDHRTADAQAYNNSGVFLSMQPKGCDAAVARFRAAIALEPTYVNPYSGLSQCLLRLGHAAEAMVALGDAIRLLEHGDAQGLTSAQIANMYLTRAQMGHAANRDNWMDDIEKAGDILANPANAAAYLDTPTTNDLSSLVGSDVLTARILVALGHRRSAVLFWEHVLKVAPGLTEPRRSEVVTEALQELTTLSDDGGGSAFSAIGEQ
jgi:tetratricopeptide (TPR) repeat protein